MIQNDTETPPDLYVGVRTDDPWVAERWGIEVSTAPGGAGACSVGAMMLVAVIATPILTLAAVLLGWALR